MNITEHIIGFDVRYAIDDDFFIKRISTTLPDTKTPRSYDRNIWPSRFRDPEAADLPSDPRKTNFRERQIPAGDKMPVFTKYSERHFNIRLWENLGNMMLRYRPRRDIDQIAAFTIFHFDKRIANCRDEDIFSSNDWKWFCTFYYDLIMPKIIKKNEWRFLGYETINDCGESVFSYKSETCSHILTRNKYNEFGLLSEFEQSFNDCRDLNANDSCHCPFFIIGVYEAIDMARLSFT